VYLWRRAVRLRPECVLSDAGFAAWLDTALSARFAHAASLTVRTAPEQPALSIRPEFVRLDLLRIGGGRLSVPKAQALQAHAATTAKRGAYYNLLHATTLEFGPVLYVGETDDLQQRIRTHTGERSPLRSRLSELGLELSDTGLHYLRLPGSDEEQRQLLEQVFAHLLVAPLTFRAG
jgi:hypothetical protein